MMAFHIPNPYYILTTSEERKIGLASQDPAFAPNGLIINFNIMKIKTVGEFKNSLQFKEPPGSLSAHEMALWWAGNGDWERAHDIVQEMNDQPSSLIHAFLHRKEGDLSNASYWYGKAGSVMPKVSLDQEWEDLVTGFLARS